MKIKKAILPVAGFGTRFLPATKAQPKEMLPIFDMPAIQFIVEEAVEAGIEDIIIVTGRGKRAIEDHFDANFELEQALKGKGKEKELEMINKISNLANFIYVRQSQPLGDGHAILRARDLIGENEPVVVLFGDDIVDNPSGINATQQLIEIYEQTKNPVVLLDRVLKTEVNKYGIVEWDEKEKNSGMINSIVEKPSIETAPSDLGIVGKFILTPEVFKVLEKTNPGEDGEIRLSNAFIDYLGQDGALQGRILEGQRFDTGDKLGFLKATLYYALKNENHKIGNNLREFFDKIA